MRFLSGLILALAGLGAIGSALGTVLGLFQDVHPAFDSFSHFRLHLIAVLSFCCVVLAVLRIGAMRRIALAIVLLGIGWLIFEFRKGPPLEGARGSVRLVQFNLNFGNPALDRVGAALAAFDADIVTLQEVTPAHEAALRRLSAYPHQTHCFFRDYIGGVSILSKHALIDIDCARGEGLVSAAVNVPGGTVTVASIHTYWPWPFTQHAQVDKWSKRLREISGPVIVAGDFNAAPWSHTVAKVEQASRTAVVPGIRMTIDVMGVPIPIDHALLSKDYCALAARVGPRTGSDHYPVIFDLARVGNSASAGCVY